MKKIRIIALAVTILLSGCGQAESVNLDNYVTKEEYDRVVEERDSYKEQLQAMNESNVLSGLKNITTSNDTETEETEKPKESTNSEHNGIEIIAEYTLDDGIGWYTRHFFVIKNNSSETLDISTSSLAYSEDGTMLGAADTYFIALGSGCVSVMYEAFDVDGKIDHYETEFSISESKVYESVIKDLEYSQNDITDGAVFQVTNNGKESAEFVEGYALFFKGNELVEYDSCYFVDDDSEIKPGRTISKQLSSYEDFDRVEFYLTGRRYR